MRVSKNMEDEKWNKQLQRMGRFGYPPHFCFSASATYPQKWPQTTSWASDSHPNLLSHSFNIDCLNTPRV